MAEENNNIIPDAFKEAVCVDAGRVYDSCCDRDCLEDLRCYFSNCGQEIINNAVNVKVNSAEVAWVYVDVEPVNFNRGYYSCDLTFFFVINFDVFSAPHQNPKQVTGFTYYSKKVILFGSEGNVKIFSSRLSADDDYVSQTRKTTNMPKCVVQCVDPIALSARIGKCRDKFECCCVIPKCVCDCIGGEVCTDISSDTSVYVTLGLFSIIQLIRNVQMLIPVYDFCMPEKRCDDSAAEPCDVFKNIKFPTDDFYPPKYFCDKEDDDGFCLGCKKD